jgi:putative FmdB family regulatory protein
MPTYRYECAKCTKVHEVFHAISDPPLERCPDCRGRLVRLISGGGGVILRGSGFHNTDYRSKSWKRDESKETGSPKAEPAKSDASAAGSPPKADATPKPETASKPEKRAAKKKRKP